MKSPNLNYKNQPPSVVSPPSSVFESVCPVKANVKVNFQFGLKVCSPQLLNFPKILLSKITLHFSKNMSSHKYSPESAILNMQHAANKAIAETVDWQI